MRSMKDKWDLMAPCGLYCGECKAFLDEECGGCRSNSGIAAEFSRICKIALCSNDKKVKVCLECDDFPCSHMDYFKARRLQESGWYIDIVGNMKDLKELGLEELCKRKDASVSERLACAKKRGVPFCDTCKDWPCRLCRNVPLISEPAPP
jgi:hypothetical protein